MAKAYVRLNSAGMEQVLTSAEMAAATLDIAQAAAARAQSTAPVATGAYRDGIRAVNVRASELGIPFKSGGDRVGAAVIADAPHALVVEAKTGNLARALRG